METMNLQLRDDEEDTTTDQDGRRSESGERGMVSRRILVRQAAAIAAGAVVARPLLAGGVRRAEAAKPKPIATPSLAGPSLKPLDAIGGILAAMDRYPVVGIGENHMVQELHDVLTALLFHPSLPGKINDIVVEFGNSAYQHLADRFILDGQPVARADLEQIWRQIGDPAWNAPVYEQFFRGVRAVNWMQPAARRIRVLLGQPPVTMSQVIAHASDRRLVATFASTPDDFIASTVEREVLNKGRKALLVAGSGHVLRGINQDPTTPRALGAAAQIAQRHPGALFSIILYLISPNTPPTSPNPNLQRKLRYQWEQDQRVAAKFAGWPRPALAHIAGTWLGAQAPELSYRALPGITKYEDQADAILYLGPGEVMTASQPDPSIYYWGAYPEQLRRSAAIAGYGDQLAIGQRWAKVGPSWYNLFKS